MRQSSLFPSIPREQKRSKLDNTDGSTCVHTFGLYSTFLAWNAIVFKSNLQSKFTVATMFLCCVLFEIKIE